jgi:hypothetical protein
MFSQTMLEVSLLLLVAILPIAYVFYIMLGD